MLKKAIRTVIGAFFFVPGFAMITFEVWRAMQANINAHVLHLVVGFVFLFIGGWLIAPVITDQISDEIIEKLPLVDRVFGGRRKTDPPLEDKKDEPPVVHLGE